MIDDDLTEEQQLKIAARLLGSESRGKVAVETKRSRKPKAKPETAHLKFIFVFDGTEEAWCDVEQQGPKGWHKLEEFDSHEAAKRAAAKYRHAGDKVDFETAQVWQRI